MEVFAVAGLSLAALTYMLTPFLGRPIAFGVALCLVLPGMLVFSQYSERQPLRSLDVQPAASLADTNLSAGSSYPIPGIVVVSTSNSAQYDRRRESERLPYLFPDNSHVALDEARDVSSAATPRSQIGFWILAALLSATLLFGFTHSARTELSQKADPVSGGAKHGNSVVYRRSDRFGRNWESGTLPVSGKGHSPLRNDEEKVSDVASKTRDTTELCEEAKLEQRCADGERILALLREQNADHFNASIGCAVVIDLDTKRYIIGPDDASLAIRALELFGHGSIRYSTIIT